MSCVKMYKSCLFTYEQVIYLIQESSSGSNGFSASMSDVGNDEGSSAIPSELSFANQGKAFISSRLDF